jgi:hypothetical protein
MAEFAAEKGAKSSEQMDIKTLRDLKTHVEAMVKVGSEDADKWLAMYHDAINYIYGNQLANIEVKGGWEPFQANYILPALMQTLALVSQQKIKILASPWEDMDRDGAEFAQGLLQFQFGPKALDINRARLDWLQDGFSNGTWAVYADWNEKPVGGWNAETKEWEGVPRVRTLRPGEYAADPNGEREDLKDAEYVFVLMPIAVDEAKERWPGNDEAFEKEALDEQEKATTKGTIGGIRVTGAAELDTVDSSAVKQGERDVGVGSTEGRLAKLLAASKKLKYTRRDGDQEKPAHVTLLEIFYRDRSTLEVKDPVPISDEELLEDGTLVEDDTGRYVMAETGEELTEDSRPVRIDEYEEPAFPNGRHVMMIGDMILNPKEEEQRWDEDKWPIRIGRFKVLPHTWHAMNGIEIVKPMQDWVNIVGMHLLNYIKYFGDPAVVIEEGALVGVKGATDVPKRIAARAGRTIVVKVGRLNSVKVLDPPAFNQGLMQSFGLMTQEIRNQTGIHEIVQGIQSKGVMTASEALRLETNSRLGIALLLVNIDAFTLDLMQWVFDILKKHMEVGRAVRIVGEESRESGVEVMEGDFDAEFDLKLEIGTALPFDEERKQQKSMQMFEMVGPPYMRRLLEAFDEPDIEDLLARVETWQMIEEQLAAAEEAEKAGLPPPEEGGEGGLPEFAGAGTGIPEDAGGFRPQ